MKRIMVTGGLGFIGSNYIRYMLNKHPDLRILNLDAVTYAAHLGNHVDNDRLSLEKVDILDAYDVSQQLLFFNPDAIVNFAAETHVDNSIHSPDRFVNTNVLGVKNLLDCIRAVKKRNPDKDIIFHQISTDEVYGSLDLNEDRYWVESDPYLPNSPYSASKASAEHFVRAYGSTYGVKWLITNSSNNYGPRCHPEKFIPKAITNLLQGKKVPVYGDGWNVRDWIYVEDHCRALDLVLHSDLGTYGKKFNIGGDEKDVTNLRILQIICGTLNLVLDDWIEFVPDRPGHDRKYALSSEKLRERTGWSCETNLVQGLRKTIDWYDQNREWWE